MSGGPSPDPRSTLVSPPPAAGGAGRRLPSRGVLVALAGAALVVLVVVFATGVLGGGGASAGNGVTDNEYPTSVSRVRLESLSSQQEVSGTLTYAGAATIVEPAGTSPADLLQAQEQAASAAAMLRSDTATLASDTTALSEAEAGLAATRAKEAVDCTGVNAAESASSGQGASGSSSGTCATDAQTESSDEQSLSQDEAKVAADRNEVSSAESALAGDEASLQASSSSATSYGQDSTYTSLPAIGAIVHRGQSLYAVGGNPAFLFYGRTAAWRTFASGMSPGSDVAELNANLDALGFGQGLGGDAFTAATAAAIDAFQAAHGVSETGELLLGSVAFEPGAVRVTAVTPTLGQTVQPGPVLTVTLTTRQVQVQLDAALAADVKVGDKVVITLANEEDTPGVVSYVGTVATTPSSNGQGSSAPTINVYVTPTDPAATGTLDQEPVNVSITTASVSHVLAVPVDSLLALSGGGYAVEEIESDGVHTLVGVSLGLFDDASGWVEVSGSGLAAGQRLVVPNI